MLYKLQNYDINQAAEILTKSFINYPIFKYIIPGSDVRRSKLPYIFSFLLKNGQQIGELLAPSKQLEGISIWINNPTQNSTILNPIRAGFIELIIKLNISELNRFLAIGNTKQKIRKQILKQPYCLLDVIGINPEFQRRGFAHLIIQNKLEELSNGDIPCYLETSNPINVSIYRQYKFALISEYKLFGIDVYCMLRENKE
jgi:hypothetical protein